MKFYKQVVLDRWVISNEPFLVSTMNEHWVFKYFYIGMSIQIAIEKLFTSFIKNNDPKYDIGIGSRFLD